MREYQPALGSFRGGEDGSLGRALIDMERRLQGAAVT
jgi:hypothetical protein